MKDGLPFEVPRTPVGSDSWRFEGLGLRQAKGDRLVFRVSPVLLLVGAVLCLFVLGFFAIEYLVWNPLWNSGDRPPGPLDGLFRTFDVVFDTVGDIVKLIVLLGGLGAMGAWFVAGRMVFDRRRGTAFRNGGKADRAWAGGIPFRVIAAVQACPSRPPKASPRRRKETSRASDERNFEINLVLSTPAGERVNVTTGSDAKCLRADAQRLAEFLGVVLLDHTEAEEERLRGWIDDGRGRDLRDAGPRLMVLRDSRGPAVLRLATGVFGVFGVGAGALLVLVLLVALVAEALFGFFGGAVEWGNVWLALLAAVGFAGVGSLLLFANLKWLRGPSVTFDRVGNRISGRGLKVDGSPVGEIALRDVRALQILRGRIRECEDFHEAWQVNIILSRPEGRRVVLLTETDEKSLRRNARRLAEFLGVPLIDYTEND